MKFIKTADIRKHLKSKGKRMARSLPLAVSVEVERLLDKAAKAAGSVMTVRDDDFTIGRSA